MRSIYGDNQGEKGVSKGGNILHTWGSQCLMERTLALSSGDPISAPSGPTLGPHKEFLREVLMGDDYILSVKNDYALTPLPSVTSWTVTG